AADVGYHNALMALVEASRSQLALEKQRWKEAYQRTLARQLVAQAQLIRTQEPGLIERSVLLALEAARRQPAVAARLVVRSGLELLPVLKEQFTVAGRVGDVAISKDGRYLAAGGGEDHLVIVRDQTTRIDFNLPHDSDVHQIILNSETATATTISDDGLRLW